MNIQAFNFNLDEICSFILQLIPRMLFAQAYLKVWAGSVSVSSEP